MTKKFIDNIFLKYQENHTVKKFVTNLFSLAVRKSAVNMFIKLEYNC